MSTTRWFPACTSVYAIVGQARIFVRPFARTDARDYYALPDGQYEVVRPDGSTYTISVVDAPIWYHIPA
jgi:hypothetical protein